MKGIFILLFLFFFTLIPLTYAKENFFIEGKKLFDLNPSQIISKLGLKNSIYKRFASYGHFGRENNCSWEKTNMVSEIKEFMKNHD